jgi:hypothetical protein
MRFVGVENVVKHQAHRGVGQVFKLEVISKSTDCPHSGHAGRTSLIGDDVSLLVDADSPGRDIEEVAVGYPPAALPREPQSHPSMLT